MMDRLPAAALGVTSDQADWTYHRIARAVAFLDAQHTAQPDLAAVANHVGLSPDHLQRLFMDWVGLSPQRFLPLLTLNALKARLPQEPTLFDAGEAVGLRRPQRGNALGIALESMPPQVYRQQGAGLTIHHGVGSTPFGLAHLAWTDRGILQLHFLPDGGAAERHASWAAAYGQADWVADAEGAAQRLQQAFQRPQPGQLPLRLSVPGTDFQRRVWQALLAIPEGQVTTYGHLAAALGQPQAAQAVGNAVGSNPVGWLIPCHRVIRSTGAITGYRWGADRKRLMLAWEAAHGNGVRP